MKRRTTKRGEASKLGRGIACAGVPALVLVGSMLPLSGLAAPGSPADEAPAKLTRDQLREASELLDGTWSPFCPGKTLSSCTSGRAAEWRGDVRAWLAEGLNRNEILERLQARVPGFQLQTIPDTDGTRYGPWILGGVFIVALAGLGIVHGRDSQKGPEGKTESATAGPAETDRRALDAELAALEDDA